MNKSKEKASLSSSLNLIQLLLKTQKCVQNNCKKEYKKMEGIQKKHKNNINKITSDLIKNAITSSEAQKRISAETIKIYNTEQRKSLLKCQSAHCNKETKTMGLASLDTFIKLYAKNKSHPLYIFSMKYKPLLSKKVVPHTILHQFDIDFQLARSNI
jgi:outer membrane protein assembly factor BamD (BamD/ComL family)